MTDIGTDSKLIDDDLLEKQRCFSNAFSFAEAFSLQDIAAHPRQESRSIALLCLSVWEILFCRESFRIQNAIRSQGFERML
jgi:hypothetical protein